MNERAPQKRWEAVAIRVCVAVLILLVGIVGMKNLKKLKKPPVGAQPAEPVLHVEVMEAEIRDYQTDLLAYGTVQTLNSTAIGSQVSGRVAAVNPRLEAGEIIQQGETLFEIDSRDYAAIADEAAALVQQLQTVEQRLTRQLALDRKRLELVQRSEELAAAEFERTKKLFLENKVGTQSGVEQSERAWNAVADQAALLANAIEIVPLQIAETRASCRTADARLVRAKLNQDRCRIKAPFTCRVKRVDVESDQIVNPGQVLVVLADDSLLELHLPLDSTDVRRRLAFEEAPNDRRAWFGPVVPVACEIRWSEDTDGSVWRGHLHRVVDYSTDTRTLTVAVRITAQEARETGLPGVPLVEGMFCSVRIPAKPLQKMVRLPRRSVTFDQRIYLSSEGRLATRPVAVAWYDDEYAYLSSGVAPGEVVVTTRLVDPLEGTLLESVAPTAEAQQ